jgi:ABC-type glycerol-3-phosphate transport system substrate-binding protein
MSHVMSRRALLRYTGLGMSGLVLAACQPKIVEVEKVVKETVVVTEKVEVEKVVKEAVEVEKEVTRVVEVQAEAKPAPRGTIPIVFWFTAENHQPEYSTRVGELNEKFDIDFKWEVMSRDVQTKKFPATLMAGSGFPDIIELNAEDVVKYLKGDDKAIPLLALNDVLDTSPYYEQVLTSRWDRYTKDGLRYAAPHDVHPIVMLYNDVAWKELGVDLSEVVTWDDYLEACSKVPKTMPDGRPRYALMDCLVCSNLMSRMLEKGLWFTDKQGEPMLTDPAFKECVEDWMRFKPYWIDRDDTVHIPMLKEGQMMTQFTPDWQYGIQKQGNLNDAALMANSPYRVARIPDFVADGPHSGTWGGTGCSIPKVAPEPALSIEIMLYLYFDNTDCLLVKRFKDTGIIPPVATAWDACPGFHEPEPFTGGQVAPEVFIEAARDLPSYSEMWATPLVSAAWTEQFPLAWEGSISVDQAIEVADKTARENIAKNA